MSSLAAIANGTSTTLIHRAADVALKQRRPLMENMTRAARAGASIVPLTVALYQRPESVDDIIRANVGRVLDLLGLDPADMSRWKGLSRKP